MKSPTPYSLQRIAKAVFQLKLMHKETNLSIAEALGTGNKCVTHWLAAEREPRLRYALCILAAAKENKPLDLVVDDYPDDEELRRRIWGNLYRFCHNRDRVQDAFVAAGYSRNAARKVQKMHGAIKYSTLLSLAKHLRVSPKELLKPLEGEMKNGRQTEKEYTRTARYD